VFKTVLAGCIFSLVLLCTFSSGAAAQSTNCYRVTWAYCTMTALWGGTPCSFPDGATNCQIAEFDGIYCQVLTNICEVPPNFCPTCGKGGAVAASPINLTNGNTYIQETDLRIPGLGGGLTLTRTWNSVLPTSESAFPSGMFGLQWRSTYEERVFSGSGEASGYIAYLQADGSLSYFPGAGGVMASPANENATLTKNGTQTWTITFHNGEKRVFSYTSGSLISIIDRNGNTTNLTYDAIGRLTTVTDPASRHLYFSYADGSSLLVTSVTSDFSVSMSYSYDSQGRLIQVTEPDQSTLSFQYNNQSLISAVLDSNGTTLESHTYDSMGRGLTSSRANGIEAVAISYPQ
jgi:YD repeat-containing protein